MGACRKASEGSESEAKSSLAGAAGEGMPSGGTNMTKGPEVGVSSAGRARGHLRHLLSCPLPEVSARHTVHVSECG